MIEKKLIKKREASVEFFIYKQDSVQIPSKSMNVFYNEKMILNRDITSLAVGAYKNLYNLIKFNFIDSMAASGITSIRLLKEHEELSKVYINDINPLAIDLINRNIELNDIDPLKIKVSHKDANSLFSEFCIKGHSENSSERVDIISIDPFGTPNYFIDMAFKAIKKKDGLLCITATDTAVLFGVKPKVCIRKYMSKPLHTEYCKEIGARILVYFLSRLANINGLGIIPLLSFYSNHFIRIFISTVKKKRRIIRNFSNYGYILHCHSCGYRSPISDDILQVPQYCPFCKASKTLKYAGPLWIGELHHEEFVRRILSLNKEHNYLNKKAIDKKLNYILEEIKMPPYYYNIHKLCQELKLPIVPKLNELINIIKKKKFMASRTHFDNLAIKSNINCSDLKKLLLDLSKNNELSVIDG
jgi:tRNA (guanine26-N2/guanine27-N2)-dimethyltransferase